MYRPTEHKSMPRARAAASLLLAVLLFCCALSAAEEETSALEQVTATGAHTYTCLYRGTERRFSVYAPEGAPTGLLFMLHGYASAGEDFRLLTGMELPANERGYAVVYPTADPASPTGWNSGIGISAADDIGFLCALAQYLQQAYGLDRSRTFAAGFSNGGFMIYRLALEGQTYFAGVAGVAAMMPAALWETRPEAAHVSVLQINGTLDDAVPMRLNGSDALTPAPAIEDVISYFAAANGLALESEEPLGTHATMTSYAAAGTKAQVRQVLIRDGRHSWPQERYCGFDVNALILDFFDRV